MSKFIKLTYRSGSEVFIKGDTITKLYAEESEQYIRKDIIRYYFGLFPYSVTVSEPSGKKLKYTIVHCDSGRGYMEVSETPNQILALIEKKVK